jgi:hypothetical protein
MKAAKEVKIIARYTNKKTGVVSYLVRSNDGESTYCTTIIDGVASGCSCPSRKGCYHKTQLVKREQERKEIAQQFAAKNAPSWLVNLVTSGQVATPRVVSKPAQQVSSPKIVDISTKGALTKSKGFSVLRTA